MHQFVRTPNQRLLARANLGGASGFTLMELTLVLMILVAMGAFVLPRFADSIERARLNASADKLRLQFDVTRLKAMKSGQVQMFRCTLDTDTFNLQPWITGAESASAGATVVTAGGTLAQVDSNGMLSQVAVQSLGEQKKLEEGITFASCLVASDMRSFSLGQQAGGITQAATMTEVILFYPDGSSSTAEIIVKNKRGDLRAVRLRGLTGSSRVTVAQNVPSQVRAE